MFVSYETQPTVRTTSKFIILFDNSNMTILVNFPRITAALICVSSLLSLIILVSRTPVLAPTTLYFPQTVEPALQIVPRANTGVVQMGKMTDAFLGI